MSTTPHPFRQLRWEDIDPLYVDALVHFASDEDRVGWGLARKPLHCGDLTTSAVMDHSSVGCAHLMARKPMTLCGLPLIPRILAVYGGGCRLEPKSQDGDRLDRGQCIGTLYGDIAQMLQAERIILNFLQHLSGVSTQTTRYVAALQGSATRVLDTRKTTPGYRVLEKYAVACGGGWNHRMGLYEWILVKDNHLSGTASSAGNALRDRVLKAKARFPGVIVEVEVDHAGQIEPVLEGGADIIMLDNFEDAALEAAVRQVAGRAITEASGGIELARLPLIAKTGVDYVSSGALIHQSQWIDIGLDWEEGS
jgi:nicotinate-nucleotide pyrophosphorylase (carboxylating)